MQHEPDEALLVEADLDEVVAAPERAEVLVVIGLLELRIVAAQRLELRRELRPGGIDRPPGSRAPGARPCGTARSIAERSGARLSGRSAAPRVVLQAIIPQPMSTPTAAGMMARRVGITEPTVAPMPKCTSGIAAMCLNTTGRRAAFCSWRFASSSTGTPRVHILTGTPPGVSCWR
jgi:hypothetical protein